jgi:NAD(P)-dependent dehydrogenase (short-subunit alcohol dehydrogenase family)
MGELSGRVALVTGGARGIGAAAARALAGLGAQVIVADVIDTSPVVAGVGGLGLRLDVTDEEDWKRAIAFARAEAGGLDILVNNAGRFLLRPLTETTLEDWRAIQTVNVEGVFLGCKHAAPALAERAGRWTGGGAIVNLSSIAGLVGQALGCAYNASKGAVRLMTKSMASEFAPLKIRVNSVHPGVIDTAMGAQVVHDFSAALGVGDNQARSQLAALHPLGDFGKPEDIGEAIAFLASDRAAFITGSELVVDGGFTAI